MEMCISADELRAALRDVETAEQNGFHHCLAVLTAVSAGPSLSECQMRYSDLLERAHPTDGRYDWGRFQGVTKRFKFKAGAIDPLVPIRQKTNKTRKSV